MQLRQDDFRDVNLRQAILWEMAELGCRFDLWMMDQAFLAKNANARLSGDTQSYRYFKFVRIFSRCLWSAYMQISGTEYPINPLDLLLHYQSHN